MVPGPSSLSIYIRLCLLPHSEDAEIHREIIAKHNEAMGSNVLRAVHRLSEALQRAGEMGDVARNFLPLQASGVVESVNKAQGQIGQFVNVTKVGALSWVEARDQGWGNTVVSVARQGGAAIGGGVAGLFGGIRDAAERAYLEQAKRIESDRAAREKPESSGGTWNSRIPTGTRRQQPTMHCIDKTPSALRRA